MPTPVGVKHHNGAGPGLTQHGAGNSARRLALDQVATHHTMLYVYLEPVAALVIAAVLLGEFFTMVQAGGALLTWLGV